MGQWLIRRGFRCRSQLRGQWRHCTALPAHLWRIMVVKDRAAKSAEHSCDPSAVKQSEFQQVELVYETENEGMGRSGELVQQKMQTPSISYAEDRGRLKLHCLPAQAIASLLEHNGAITLISALDATRPFPERKWSLPSNSRQGFLTPGSSASLRGLPNLRMRSVTMTNGSYANRRYTVAGTVRALHPLPLSPSMGTCDGQRGSFRIPG